VKRKFATLFIFAVTFASMGGLSGCAETAKEDPVKEQIEQQQIQQPEQTQPPPGELTERTIGKNIQG
jgi:hypothetical protein